MPRTTDPTLPIILTVAVLALGILFLPKDPKADMTRPMHSNPVTSGGLK